MSTAMSSRRSTLGPLNMAQINSRALPPPRVSNTVEIKDLALMKPSSRMSFGPSSNNQASMIAVNPLASQNNNGRRSSLVPPPRKSSLVPQRTSSISTANVGRTTDPRNITDKQFLSNSIRTLVEYLTEHNYDHPISPKILTKPTNKDYYNIVLFLFRQIDPNYTCVGKLEDEIVAMFRFLGYPFPIAKSNISAVGSPHAWPSMLASIMWLIELLTYNSCVIQSEQQALHMTSHGISAEETSDTPSGNALNSTDKHFYNYLHKAYEVYMLGDRDELYQQIEEQYVASFENQNVLLRDQIESNEQKIILLTNDIDIVKQRSAYLPEIDKKRKDMQQEMHKINHLVEDKTKHMFDLQANKQDKLDEYDKLHVQMTLVSKEISILKHRIAHQEISPDDVANMMQEKERLEEAHKIASEHRQSLQKRIWELEMTLRDKVQLLEDTVRAYHTIGEDLKMVPASARNARGEDLSIEIDTRAKRREGLLKTAVKIQVVPKLQEVREELKQMSLQLRSESIDEKETLDELKTSKIQLTDLSNTLETKLKRVDLVYNREKENYDSINDVQSKELDAMETRLLQLRDTTIDEAKITSFTRLMTELVALKNSRNVEYETQKNTMIQNIMEAVALCANLRENVQQKVGSVKDVYEEKLSRMILSKKSDGDIFKSQDEFNAVASGILSHTMKYPATVLNLPEILDNGLPVLTIPHKAGKSSFKPKFHEEELLSPIHQQQDMIVDDIPYGNQSMISDMMDLDEAAHNLSLLRFGEDPTRVQLRNKFESVV